MTNQGLTVAQNGAALVGAMTEDDKNRYQKNVFDSLAGESIRAYKSRFARFAAWCEDTGRASYPATAATVAAYLETLEKEGKTAATIAQVIAAISKAHTIGGVENPCLSEVVKAARKASRRRLGVAPHQKAAATVDVVRALVSGIEGMTLTDKRDKALLLCGFAGAFRRSELVGLRVSDLTEEKTPEGRPVFVVTVRHSKTDQEGRGMNKAIFAARPREKRFCPVAALREWIAAAGLAGDDPLFPRIRKGGQLDKAAPLGGDSVALIIKKRAAAAGVELELSGHSLRRGFVTSAIAAGASERSIMNQTGHKSPMMVRRYIERASVVSDNAAALL